MNWSAFFRLGAALAVLPIIPARADVLPPATGSVGYLSSIDVGQFVQGPPNESLSDLQSPTIFQEAQSSGAPEASAEVSGNGTAGAGLLYYFEIEGPYRTTPIDVTLNYMLLVAGNYTPVVGSGDGAFLISDSNGLIFADASALGNNMIGQFLLPLSWNTPIEVQINADAAIEPIYVDDFSSVFASLFISLDPALTAEGYSLVFSAGIDNEAVPESSSLALAGAGLILAALMRRFRKEAYSWL